MTFAAETRQEGTEWKQPENVFGKLVPRQTAAWHEKIQLCGLRLANDTQVALQQDFLSAGLCSGYFLVNNHRQHF